MQISQNVRADVAPKLSDVQLNGTTAPTSPTARSTDSAPPVVQSVDTAAISSTATLLALALSSTSPESSRVTEISSSLASGNYRIDSAVLATNVMDSMLNYGA